jgi:hypothetical protein
MPETEAQPRSRVVAFGRSGAAYDGQLAGGGRSIRRARLVGRMQANSGIPIVDPLRQGVNDVAGQLCTMS